MLRVTVRDIQHRRRQFAIAVVGAGVVFGLALLLSGVSQGFRTEVRDTVGSARADAWGLAAGVESPFSSAVSAAKVPAIARAAGARSARAFVFAQDGARMPDGERQNVAIVGLPGGAPRGSAVADEHVLAKAGQTVLVGGRPLTIDHLVSGATVFGGQPVLYVDLPTAQMLRFGNTRTASGVLLRGAFIATSLRQIWRSQTTPPFG